MTPAFSIAEASRVQAALAGAIASADADAIVAASNDLQRLIDAAGHPTPKTESRPAATLRADIVATHQTLNLLRDAAARRAGFLADLRGQARVATYGQRPAA